MPEAPPNLISALRCPETRAALTLLEPEALIALNQQIAAGELRAESGDVLRDALDGALRREDGQVIYPRCRGVWLMNSQDRIRLV